MRDLEAELEEERKQRTNALAGKKKLEAEFAELDGQIESATKSKEDALRQLKKTQVNFYVVVISTLHWWLRLLNRAARHFSFYLFLKNEKDALSG